MMGDTENQDEFNQILGDDADKLRTETVDLDSTLSVCISDALTQQDKVKFTVQTKTKLKEFAKEELTVTRLHEEFVWLHDRLVECEDYAGLIIPPAPPRPDFDASRDRLHKLGEMSDGVFTKEEFEKMKKELEQEYLATFKKTVAMHEVFLQRIAAHPSMRHDHNFKVFLEFESDLSVRLRGNVKEKLGSMFSWAKKTADEVLLSGSMKDSDGYFDKCKQFLVEYHTRIKDAAQKSDQMTRAHKVVADSYINISHRCVLLANIEESREAHLHKVFARLGDSFEAVRKLDARVSSDEDLKLTDTLRYYMRDSEAAKDLLFRLHQAMAVYESSNKALDKARLKAKDVEAAEAAQQTAKDNFDKMSASAREELDSFKSRRINHFQKNLTDLVELEIRHAKSEIQILRDCIDSVKRLQ